MPVNLNKGSIVFREGEPNEFVYFVRDGEIQISKRVMMPKLGADAQDVVKLL